MTEILIVDDDPHSMEILSTRLRHRGFDVIKAYDGETGISMAHQHHPDMILLDLQLPDIDGYEVLSKLRAQHDISKIPVIAISAGLLDRDLETKTNEHFDSFVIKPVMPEYLFEKIAKSGINIGYE